MCSLWWWTSVSAIRPHQHKDLSSQTSGKPTIIWNSLTASSSQAIRHKTTGEQQPDPAAFRATNALWSQRYLSWFPLGYEPSSSGRLVDMCSRIVTRWEKAPFHIKTALSSQPWGCHWEASVWLRSLFKAHSLILPIIVPLRPDGVVWGEKCPV